MRPTMMLNKPHSLRNLTTGELDLCFELLFDITYLSSNLFAFSVFLKWSLAQ